MLGYICLRTTVGLRLISFFRIFFVSYLSYLTLEGGYLIVWNSN